MGSPLWQGALFLAGTLFLVFETWRGWRMGVVRAGLHLAAIALSTLAGFAVAHVAAAPFGGLQEPGGFITGSLVGTGVGLIVFVGLWLLAALLFKRTEHQSSGVVRLAWGVGGAACGFLLGLMILWGGISIIRALGSLAEARLTAPPGKPASTPPPLAANLVKLKDSLELGPTGRLVESVDPLPPDFYAMITQVGTISSSEPAMLRFLQYPGMQDILQNPKMIDLLNDPGVQEAARSRNVLALLANKAVLAAVQDPKLAEQLKKIDLRKALDYAMPAPSPTPSPTPAH